MMAEVLLQAADIGFAYGETRVLQQISLTLSAGQYVSLIGPNGSGKTTLLNILCGGRQAQTGRVTYGGMDVHRMAMRQRAQHFAVIHQHENSDFPFTCLETVLMGLHPQRSRFGRLSAAQLNKAERIMTLTETEILADKLLTQLSGGQLQRVILARALLQEPKILFMDEAMSDLDISAKIKMIKLLKALIAESGMTVLAINHDINTAYKFSDHILALKDGQLVAQGAPQQIMDEDFFARVFAVKTAIFAGEGFFIQDNL